MIVNYSQFLDFAPIDNYGLSYYQVDRQFRDIATSGKINVRSLTNNKFKMAVDVIFFSGKPDYFFSSTHKMNTLLAKIRRWNN